MRRSLKPRRRADLVSGHPLPHRGVVTGPSTFDLCRPRSDASPRGLAWALGLVYTPGTTRTQTPVLFQFETRSRRKRSSPPQTQTCHGPSHHPERLPPEDSGSRAGAIDRSVSPHGLHLAASPETPVVGTFFLFLRSTLYGVPDLPKRQAPQGTCVCHLYYLNLRAVCLVDIFPAAYTWHPSAEVGAPSPLGWERPRR